MKDVTEYFELEVSLRGVEPRIWRRFSLRSRGTTFQDLHKAIQDACGWEDCHMFLFRHPSGPDQVIAGIPSEEDLDLYDEELPAADSVELSSYFGEGGETTCIYEYDFGDGWLHEVSLVRTVSSPEKFKRRLLGGARAFPREDSGGIGGYERFVELLKTGEDPDGEDPDELREWLEGWEPERFDLDEAKAAFDRPRPKAARGPKSAESAGAGSKRGSGRRRK